MKHQTPVICFLSGVLTALLLNGCSPQSEPAEPVYRDHFEQGTLRWSEAQTLIETDPAAGLPVLLNAREAFLRAAISRPGDSPSAQQIAGITAQIRSVEKRIAEQEKEQEDLQRKLQEAVERLELLTQQETALSLQSQQMLRKRPPAAPAEQIERAEETVRRQVGISTGTGEVLDIIKQVQNLVRKMVAAVYGEDDTPPPTEFDEAAEQLAQARTAQNDASEHLKEEPLRWPPANAALLTASRRMQAALQLLTDQTAGQTPDQPSDSDLSEWDYDEDMEWAESDTPADQSMPMSSQNLQTSLENRTLPAPNYTAEEILNQEAENQAQRAQQKAGRAGANVEKNW
jgi:Ca-activated chloride channel homolog